MRKYHAFTVAEITVALILTSFLFAISIPSLISGSAEKIYANGFSKAFKTVSAVTNKYLETPDALILPDETSAVDFVKYFIESAEVKALYAEENPDKNSDTYSNLKFRNNVLAGAKNPTSVSNEIQIKSTPSFWFVTDDNLAYSVIIPDGANCEEVLNINTAHNLTDTLTASCFAVVVDTNGIFANPNTIEDMQDISNEEYIPNLTKDRYYIFIGDNGVAAGNPKHILSAKVYGGKSNL